MVIRVIILFTLQAVLLFGVIRIVAFFNLHLTSLKFFLAIIFNFVKFQVVFLDFFIFQVSFIVIVGFYLFVFYLYHKEVLL